MVNRRFQRPKTNWNPRDRMQTKAWTRQLCRWSTEGSKGPRQIGIRGTGCRRKHGHDNYADGQQKVPKAQDKLESAGQDADESMDTTTMLMVEEVLETMGRTKDKAYVVDLLQSHLI